MISFCAASSPLECLHHEGGVFEAQSLHACLIQMGRTIRTFREAVDIESAKRKTFRRQLKPDDRARLDKTFDYARMHADSGTVISIPHKIDVVFIVGNMVSSHWFRLLNPHT